MQNIPHSVLKELSAAVTKTGCTPKLRWASERLTKIFSMTPEQFEAITAPIFRSEGNDNGFS